MPPNDPPPHQTQDLGEQPQSAMHGLRNLVDRLMPWLFEVGTWVFGGLIAFNLVLISALITVGPVDAAIRISITAFACALPLNLAGMLLLRLVKDAKEIGLDDLTLQAFQDAGFSQIEAYFPASPDRDLQRKRRSNLTLMYCLGIVILSGALTIAGLMAALWHMAWWIAAALGAAIIFSAVLVVGVFAQFVQPESDAEKELKRRYVEEQLKKKEHH